MSDGGTTIEMVQIGQRSPGVDVHSTQKNSQLNLVDTIPINSQEQADQELHTRALDSFQHLRANSSAEPILSQYITTIQSADIGSAIQVLNGIKGTEQIVSVAGGNYQRLIDRLLVAASDVQIKGYAPVSVFGNEIIFHSLDQIEQVFKEIQLDMDRVNRVINERIATGDPDSTVTDILSILNKYMFDERNLEREYEKKSKMLVIRDPTYPGIVDQLKKEQILDDDGSKEGGNASTTSSRSSDTVVTQLSEYKGKEGRNHLIRKIEQTNLGDMESDNYFLSLKKLPQTVILHVPTEESFKSNHYSYQNLFADWVRLPYKDRPRVIVYCQNFTPRLYLKHSYQGFMFCSTPDELRRVVRLSEQLAEDQTSNLYNPESLTPKQKEAYDNSNLREWENKTADTYQSLAHIFKRFKERSSLLHSPDDPIAPDREITTILDLGTGEGRIAQALVRAGYHVMGLDISEEQLRKNRQRIYEEGEGLRRETEHPGLSYEALLKLKDQGLLPQDLILNDQVTEDHYPVVQGSFFYLQSVLNTSVVEWVKRYPNMDPYIFFNEHRWNNYAFSDPRDIFADIGFDVAMFNWNTFCEIGSPENQKDVLEQILNVLNLGGELIIEIPDRNIEPYASSLQKYHAEHPDEPYGTIRDPKPKDFKGLDGDDLYPPRYFPDVNELVLLLKSVGYEIDPRIDIQPYLIEEKDPSTGERKMVLKENFITARKSKR